VYLAPAILERLRAAVGPAHVRIDPEICRAYGVDALKRGHPADAVVTPVTAREISAVARV
jgi:FAD/FMN-containing dehydrogenase